MALQYATSDATSPSLLDLPKELRLQIYEELLKPSELELWTWGFTGCISKSESRCHARPIGKRLFTAILQTCKLIHDEAWVVPYTPASIWYRPRMQSRPPYTSRGAFNLELLKHMRRLDTLELEVITDSAKVEDDKANFLAFASKLHASLKVKRMDLTIRERGCEGLDHDNNRELDAAIEQVRLWLVHLSLETAHCVLALDVNRRHIAVWEKTCGQPWVDRLAPETELQRLLNVGVELQLRRAASAQLSTTLGVGP